MAPIPEEVDGNDSHSSDLNPAANSAEDLITPVAAATCVAGPAFPDKSTQTLQASCTQGTMTDDSAIASIKYSPEMPPRSTAGACHSIALLSGSTPPDGGHFLVVFHASHATLDLASSAKVVRTISFLNSHLAILMHGCCVGCSCALAELSLTTYFFI